MSRRLRIALVLALAVGLAPPQSATAAPSDHHRAGVSAVAQQLVARLWEPLMRLLGAADAAVGPSSDPNGLAGSDQGAAPPGGSETTNAGEAEGDVGPSSDPDG